MMFLLLSTNKSVTLLVYQWRTSFHGSMMLLFYRYALSVRQFLVVPTSR